MFTHSSSYSKEYCKRQQPRGASSSIIMHSQATTEGRKRAKRSTKCEPSASRRLFADPAEDQQDSNMADEPNWEAENEETDVRDVEALVDEPESTDDYRTVDIRVPGLFTRPRKLERCKNDLRRSFNVNAVIERPPDCHTNDVIRVEGYGFDSVAVLSCVRRHDSNATIVN